MPTIRPLCEARSIPVPASVASGAGTDVRDLEDFMTVQVSGTFVASLDLEGSIDGSSWSPVISGITAPGLFRLETSLAKIRATTTAYTSGTPVAKIAGFPHE